MLNILSVEQTIKQIFRQFLERVECFHSSGEIGVRFVLEIDGNNFGYEADGNTFHPDWVYRCEKYVHVIITNRYSVFVAISTSADWTNISLEEWENTSNHDDCWCSDGLKDIFSAYIDVYHNCYPDWIPYEHRPAPIASNINGNLSPLGITLLNYVKIEKTRTQNSKKYLEFSLTSIQELKYKIMLEE